jgi:hypothetical protein
MLWPSSSFHKHLMCFIKASSPHTSSSKSCCCSWELHLFQLVQGGLYNSLFCSWRNFCEGEEGMPCLEGAHPGRVARVQGWVALLRDWVMEQEGLGRCLLCPCSLQNPLVASSASWFISLSFRSQHPQVPAAPAFPHQRPQLHEEALGVETGWWL